MSIHLTLLTTIIIIIIITVLYYNYYKLLRYVLGNHINIIYRFINPYS